MQCIFRNGQCIDPPPQRKCSDFPWRHIKKSMWRAAIFFHSMISEKPISRRNKRILQELQVKGPGIPWLVLLLLTSSLVATRVACEIIDRQIFIWMFSSESIHESSAKTKTRRRKCSRSLLAVWYNRYFALGEVKHYIFMKSILMRPMEVDFQ